MSQLHVGVMTPPYQDHSSSAAVPLLGGTNVTPSRTLLPPQTTTQQAIHSPETSQLLLGPHTFKQLHYCVTPLGQNLWVTKIQTHFFKVLLCEQTQKYPTLIGPTAKQTV